MKHVSAHCVVLLRQVDMLDEEQVEGMVQVTVAKWGRVDYAVNCAGILPFFLAFSFVEMRLIRSQASWETMRDLPELALSSSILSTTSTIAAPGSLREQSWLRC